MPSGSMRGQLLVATPALQEPTFARAVVLLLEHSASDGALGVVVNRPTPVAVADVVAAVADLATEPALLFEGGPVSPTTAIGLGSAVPGALAEAGPDELAAGLAPVMPPLVTFDRPYLMLVTDRATGEPLFMARVADPSRT